MDQADAKLPEEQVAHKTGRNPLLLTRGFGDFARFGGADLALGSDGSGGHGCNLPWASPRQQPRPEEQGGARAARETSEVCGVVDVGAQEPGGDLVGRPDEEHETDAL